MDFGVGYFPTHDGMRPGPLARLVEERFLLPDDADRLIREADSSNVLR